MTRVWLDFAAPTPQRVAVRASWGAPLRVLQAQALQEVLPLLAAVEQAAQAGHWCVGYLRYEAAPAMDAAFEVHPPDGPLAWFGVFAPPPQADAQPSGSDLGEPARDVPWSDDRDGDGARASAAAPAVATWAPGRPRADFDDDIRHIHDAIAQGRYYQINHTQVLQGRLTSGTPWALFQALRRAQPGGYAAYLDTGAEQLLSVSPELFFDWDGEQLLTRPMKGTAARGRSPQADAAQAEYLRTSPKERAENVMIVDLLRNDLSRVAQPHSVQVPRLFHTEALPSVWQMTSDVTARTRPGTGLVDIFQALFPCGSITGAPKVEAMCDIRRLEAGPRGPYCGAIGVVRPGASPGTVAATFNVGIRTVVVRGEVLQCGIGSGITADATADGEWQEWRHKRAFVDRASEPFDLLETLGLSEGVWRDRDAHLARMAAAAAHFRYPWRADHARQVLEGLVRTHPAGDWRVRVLCNAAGEVTAQAHASAPMAQPVRLVLADRCFDAAHSEFVRFKTTRRAHYQVFEPQTTGVFDTVLWNREGQLTECTRGNIALRIGGRWLTPPVSAGLLDGVGRRRWLASGRLHEAELRLDDLRRAEGVAFINSLRGWLDAVLD